MNISNQTLTALLLVTLLLVGAAVALTFAGGSEPPSVPEVETRSVQISVLPKVTRIGDQKIDPNGPLLVEIDKGTDAPSATLECGATGQTPSGESAAYKSEHRAYKGRLGIASLPFGSCGLRLAGTEQAFSPVYPGDRLKCRAEGVRTVCTGGIATEKAGIVSVHSEIGGQLFVDGQDSGPLPVEKLKMNVGNRGLIVRLADGQEMQWTLNVNPGEQLVVEFPDPGTSQKPQPQPNVPGEPPAVPPPEGAVTPTDGTTPTEGATPAEGTPPSVPAAPAEPPAGATIAPADPTVP